MMTADKEKLETEKKEVFILNKMKKLTNTQNMSKIAPLPQSNEDGAILKEITTIYDDVLLNTREKLLLQFKLGRLVSVLREKYPNNLKHTDNLLRQTKIPYSSGHWLKLFSFFRLADKNRKILNCAVTLNYIILNKPIFESLFAKGHFK